MRKVIIEDRLLEYQKGFRDCAHETMLLMIENPNLASDRYVDVLKYVMGMIDDQIKKGEKDET